MDNYCNMSANNETLYNEDIRAAVRYLLGQGIIEADKDVAEKVGLSKSTVSPYLSGKERASTNFRTKFEEVFNVKLSDFVSADINTPLPPGNIVRTLADYIIMIERFNKTMSEAISAGLISLKEGQKQLGEQLFVVGDGLRQQLEGIASGLAARDRNAEKDKGVSGQKGNIHGKNKDL